MNFEKVLAALLFPLMIPFVIVMFIANLLTGGKSFAGFFEDAENHAHEEEDMKRVHAEVVATTPSLDTQKEVKSKALALVEAEDWRGLADWMTSLDKRRAACTANISLAETALAAVLDQFAVETFDGHTCHPDPILWFEDDTAEMFERHAAASPDTYPLRVIAAQMRCYQGWTHRGADYAVYVSDDGWFGMGEKFAQAASLLDAYDPAELDAPLLAATRHELLAFMPNAERYVRPFYEDWSNLDPITQTPHQKHALMMLPRWFGSDHDLQIAAAQAAARTQSQTGEAAYFSVYRAVLDHWDPNVLSMDERRFSEGAYDFLDLRNNDPATVGELIDNMRWWSAFGADWGLSKVQKLRRKELSRHFKALSQDLIRERLTAIYPEAWDEGEIGCRREILDACRQELNDGQNVIMGDTGLAFRPAQMH